VLRKPERKRGERNENKAAETVHSMGERRL
jgi:hypothetical protein